MSIDLDEQGDAVVGFLFVSENLTNQWPMLDEFEGEGYQRVATRATLADGEEVDAYIYQLTALGSDRITPKSGHNE